MPSNTFSTTGLKDLELALTELGKKAGLAALTGALRDASKPVLKQARQSASIRSGNLKKGIRVETFRGKGKSDSVATLQMGYHKKTAFYGQILETGAKAHRIPTKTVGRGKSKRANKAKVAFGGKVYSNVNHPGTKAKPLLAPALNSKYLESIKIFKQRLRERIITQAIKKYGKSAK